MADELLFDSDRLALKEKRKPRLILIAAIVGVLLITVAIALIIRGAKKDIHKGGEDGPYPYTWQGKKNGAIYLRIDHKQAPDLRWALLENEGQMNVTVTRDRKDKGRMTGFVIQPEGEGSSTFILVLQNGDDAATRLYEYRFTVLAKQDEDGKLQTELLQKAGIRRQAEIRGATDTDNPYRIYSAENGDMIVAVKSSGLESDWNCEILSGEDCVDFLGVTFTEEGATAVFRPLAPGRSKVRLTSEYAAAELQLTLDTDQNDGLTVVSHDAVFGEKPEAPKSGEGEKDASAGLKTVTVEKTEPAETKP